MARRKGSIRVKFTPVGTQMQVAMLYSGPQGRRTLGKSVFDMTDRKAGKDEMARWIASRHPKIRLTEQTGL